MRPTTITAAAAAVLAAGALILFIGGGARFAIGLTLKPMEADFGGGRSLIGISVAMFQVVSAVAMFVAGRLADRIDLARVFAAGLVIAAAGMAAMHSATAAWQIVVLYGIVFAIGNGIASVIPVGVLVTRHFVGNAGFANAVALTGMGLGQLTMMVSLAAVLDDTGWRRVYLWLGLAHLIVVPLVWLAIRRASVPATSPAINSTTRAEGLSIREAMRTRQFWLLLAIYSLCGLEDFFVSTHIVAFAQDRGIGTLVAGSLLGLMGLMALIGVLVSGAVSDRTGPIMATFAAFALRVAIFAAILLDQSQATAGAFALLFGLTFLVTAPLTVIFVRDTFGTRHLGALTGLITMVHHIWGGIGAAVGAAYFDAQGSYDTVLVLMLVSSVLGCVLTLAMGRKSEALARP